MTGFNKVLPDKEGGNFLFFTVYWGAQIYERVTPFYIVSFLHFKMEIPKKKDVMRGDIHFISSFFSAIIF
jgi:hypothetical protein